MAISSIDRSEVQRITSGQVIVDLVSVVKELVENAIDASSTKIEVTFANNGLQYIKVEDDGCGIDQDDFAAVCLRHHTSKIRLYDDLARVNTLGFRGEAMSSICSVANLAIHTCTEGSFPRMTQLTFDNMGNMTTSKRSVGGLRGTIVTVTSLFDLLPVRRKTLEKNIKREFQKAVNNLVGYVLMHPEIRFTIYNVNASNKKQMIFGTQGHSTLKQSLIGVYGSNGAYGLEALSLEAKELDVRFKLNVGEMPVTKRLDIKFDGLISDSSFGMGRSAADRQFVFLNKRPVQSKKLLKTINEVYRTFNTVQFPVVVLNITLDGEFLDINVTPDKRTVMIHNEDVVNDVLRDELTGFYQSRDTKIPVNMSQSRAKEPRVDFGAGSREDSRGVKRLLERFAAGEKTLQERDELEERTEQKERDKYEDEDEGEEDEEEEEEEEGDEEEEEDSQNDAEVEDMAKTELQEMEDPQSDLESDEKVAVTEVVLGNDNRTETDGRGSDVAETTSVDGLAPEVASSAFELVDPQPPMDTEVAAGHENDRTSSARFDLEPASDTSMASVESPQPNGDIDEFEEDITISIGNRHFVHSPKKVPNRQSVIGVRKPLFIDKTELQRAGVKSTCTAGPLGGNFHIDNIADSDAEDKLTYLISKQDFARMQIVGQFNLGFILVTLNDGKNLFIVDQHASDEKYNFERLANSTTVFHSQQLVVSRQLELNVLDEMTVMSNLEVFKTNGFGLLVDEDAAPGHRVRLTSLPVLRSTVFDDSDMHELIHLCNQAASASRSHIKCSKIRTVLALRSCRSSIMIGQPLSAPTMRRVVDHLTLLDKPWNCPHGRPTMRHLSELGGFVLSTRDYQL